MISTTFLRQKILSLAIQGKLVPQNPADKPATDLIKRIKEEKKALVKAGKIKKDKFDSTICKSDDGRWLETVDGVSKDITEEIPFEIPESWTWARLGFISNYSESKNKVKPTDCSPDMWELNLEDIEKGGRILAKKSVGEQASLGIKTVFHAGEILYSKLSPYLLKILLAPMDGICTPEIIPFSCYGKIHAEYIVNYLKSPWVSSHINSKSYGIILPRVGTNTMTNLLIPIPPLAEQQRIVEVLKGLFDDVEKIECCAKELKESVAFTRQKVLSIAIRGQLVPQDPADEPATNLIKRIKEEKKALVKAEKIKKDKFDSTICKSDDGRWFETVDGVSKDITEEIPFEIPESWAWTRLKSILLPSESKRPSGEFFDYIDIAAVDNSTNQITAVQHLSVANAPSRASRGVRTGDTLFSIVRPYLRNIAMVTEDHCRCIASTGFHVCRPSCGIKPKYLFECMLSNYIVNSVNAHMKGEHSPSVRSEEFENILFPLPPLAEQQRIVSKIESVFSDLDKIEC